MLLLPIFNVDNIFDAIHTILKKLLLTLHNPSANLLFCSFYDKVWRQWLLCTCVLETWRPNVMYKCAFVLRLDMESLSAIEFCYIMYTYTIIQMMNSPLPWSMPPVWNPFTELPPYPIENLLQHTLTTDVKKLYDEILAHCKVISWRCIYLKCHYIKEVENANYWAYSCFTSRSKKILSRWNNYILVIVTNWRAFYLFGK